MALLYVFPVGEYIQFRDQNDIFLATVHYTELSFSLDAFGNVQFLHRRESLQTFPIRSAPFAEVVNVGGTPYSVVDLDTFVAVFTAALPVGSGSSGSNLNDALKIAVAKTLTNTVRGAGSYSVPAAAEATRVTIIALAASTFSYGGVTYPLSTAGSGTVVDLDIRAGVGRVLDTVAYTVLTGTVLEIVEN